MFSSQRYRADRKAPLEFVEGKALADSRADVLQPLIAAAAQKTQVELAEQLADMQKALTELRLRESDLKRQADEIEWQMVACRQAQWDRLRATAEFIALPASERWQLWLNNGLPKLESNRMVDITPPGLPSIWRAGPDPWDCPQGYANRWFTADELREYLQEIVDYSQDQLDPYLEEMMRMDFGKCYLHVYT